MTPIYPVGIDLGTTQSAMAYVDAHGTTQMIRNAEGELLTPSVVLFGRDKILIGREASRARTSVAGGIAEMAKRDMGQPHYRHRIHGRRLPAEVIQGYILRKLHDDIALAVGGSNKVVITVPAYFDEPRRKATADAGEMSGLTVLDIINEPMAAALAFGEQLGYLDATGEARDIVTLLVYDLGGGTFDVTILRLEPGNVTTLSTDGDVELGGYNWDMRLVEHIRGRFLEKHGIDWNPNRANESRVRRIAEEAKHRLSTHQETKIRFDIDGKSLDTTVSCGEFEAMAAELVERTAFTTRQALRAADLLWTDIDRLLLVGGSTRMPMVQSMLENLSRITPDTGVNPDEAVARGAAIYAQHLLALRGICSVARDLTISDVNAHSLGVEGISQETLRKENIVLIPRNTHLPSEIRRTFVTQHDNQRSVKIQLLEGDSTLPSQCTPLAKAAIRNLPPELKKGTEVEICYRFEANGRLSVQAKLADLGQEAQIELERLRGLTDTHAAKWKQVICRDGGFEDFGDAILQLLETDVDESDQTQQLQGDKTVVSMERSLEPAVPYGAPLAASDTLKREQATKKTPRWVANRSARRKLLVFLVGYVSSSLIGLALGYYILCWIRPDSNFLGIDLPGLSSTSTSRDTP